MPALTTVCWEWEPATGPVAIYLVRLTANGEVSHHVSELTEATPPRWCTYQATEGTISVEVQAWNFGKIKGAYNGPWSLASEQHVVEALPPLPPQPVPEPAGGLLLVSGLLLLALLARWRGR